jgi:hypothetical protein
VHDGVELALDHVHYNSVALAYNRGHYHSLRLAIACWWDTNLAAAEKGEAMTPLTFKKGRTATK